MFTTLVSSTSNTLGDTLGHEISEEERLSCDGSESRSQPSSKRGEEMRFTIRLLIAVL